LVMIGFNLVHGPDKDQGRWNQIRECLTQVNVDAKFHVIVQRVLPTLLVSVSSLFGSSKRQERARLGDSVLSPIGVRTAIARPRFVAGHAWVMGLAESIVRPHFVSGHSKTTWLAETMFRLRLAAGDAWVVWLAEATFRSRLNKGLNAQFRHTCLKC
jgi:hypothetical protein